ncbi:hypothetical protein LEN26_002372 [Aphanomyces euteiches]|nr:hypothetical protein AeMF1_016241 [Aphanomyces euteiches]KAH9159366.1 hypothetical protein LEN26_002372 [Aphanomyces euteiches]KAH9192983.1 hypothetical protein AeNC1_005040 [Aphanomyces euteiches]
MKSCQALKFSNLIEQSNATNGIYRFAMQLKHLFLVAGVVAAQCDRACPDVVEPVCASDGKTYNNPCLVEVAACSQKKNIIAVAQGECKDCDNRVCDLIGLLVCGSDGQPYGNPCFLSIATCRNASITLVRYGSCEKSSNNTCKTLCNMIYSPVCGSNAQTYGNDCALKNAACEDPSLSKVSEGECPNKNSTNTTRVPSTTLDNSVTGTTDVPKTTAPTTTASKSASTTVMTSVAAAIVVMLFSLWA